MLNIDTRIRNIVFVYVKDVLKGNYPPKYEKSENLREEGVSPVLRKKSIFPVMYALFIVEAPSYFQKLS